MAIQREIWVQDIVENIYKANPWLLCVYNADQYVMQGKVVHLPQSGAAPSVKKNRSSLPATVTKRTDTDITFSLDEFTSDPVHIGNAEEVETSYNKRDSVLSDTKNALSETVADVLLEAYAPTKETNKLYTSGDAVAATAPSATGNRKAIQTKDLSRMQALFNKQNIPAVERYALLPADMYQQLVEQMSETQYAAFSRAADPEKGTVGELYGFKIMCRSSVMIYGADGVCKTTGAAAATTDCEAALFWQKNSILKAVGDIKFFESMDEPTYYGDIYSALVRAGARIRRADEKGIAVMIQTTVAASTTPTSEQ